MTTEAEVFEALKYRIDVDEYGNRRYYNALGQLHRLDGPAIVYPTGAKAWYRNGLRHRTDDPAIVHANGAQEWYHNGQRHRVDGPAVVWKGGHTDWWLNGILYTEQNYYAQLKALGHTV